MTTYTDIGIIIKQFRYQDADKYVHIFSSEHGLIRVIAKGARKLTSRKSPHLDSLNLIKFQVRDHYLLQAETINSFSVLKSNLQTVRTCFYILEILNQVLPENQVDKPLFISLLNYLNFPNNHELNMQFQLYLIKHLGFKQPDDTSPQGLINYFEHLLDRKLKSTKIKL